MSDKRRYDTDLAPWVADMAVGIRAHIRSSKHPYFRQCPYRAMISYAFPKSKCVTCEAEHRRNCRYARARNNQGVAYHGPDFRPMCVYGLPVRCGVSALPSRADCGVCLGEMPKNPWVIETVTNGHLMAESEGVAMIEAVMNE